MKKILFLHTGSEMYGADKVMLDLIKNLDKTNIVPMLSYQKMVCWQIS